MATILIIDDDTRNIYALKAVLLSRGYEVEVASNAAEGYQLLQGGEQVSMVLLDMMMPDQDGYEMLSVIRSNDQLKALPVVAVTAQAMPGDREKCLAAGADDYLSKPIDVDRLLETIQKYIN